VWAFLLGYFFFNELPTIYVFIGAGIIAGAGLFLIWRERQLGLQRTRAAGPAHRHVAVDSQPAPVRTP